MIKKYFAVALMTPMACVGQVMDDAYLKQVQTCENFLYKSLDVKPNRDIEKALVTHQEKIGITFVALMERGGRGVEPIIHCDVVIKRGMYWLRSVTVNGTHLWGDQYNPRVGDMAIKSEAIKEGGVWRSISVRHTTIE